MIEIGQKFATNEGCVVEVIKYDTSSRVLVKFIDDYGYERTVTATNIRNGEIKNPYHRSVFGVGYFGVGEYKAKVGDITTYEYVRWQRMMGRCYDEQYAIRQPCYINCTVKENWHNFQIFAEWLSHQIGYGNKGWHLDKDILAPGNKIYSEHVCVLIPQEINALLTGGDSSKHLAKGIFEDARTGKFIAQCRYKKKIYRVGVFSNPTEALSAYKEFKKDKLRQTAREYKDLVDVRVYDILMDYPDYAI